SLAAAPFGDGFTIMSAFRTLLTGLSAGATAMYFYDPVRGEARRTRLTEKVTNCVREITDSACVVKRTAETKIDRVVAAASGRPTDIPAAHAASDQPTPTYNPDSSGNEEAWSPVAEAAMKLSGYAVLGKLALGRAFWPTLVGGTGLYYAAKQGA